MKLILFIFIITSFFTIDSFAIGSSDRTLYFEKMDSKNKSVIDVLKSLDLTGTGYFKYPIGTTAQRPTASTGMSRYNSDEGCLELYDGSEWFCVGAGGGGGSSGLNIVSDFSFENEELAPDALAGGTFSYESYTVDDELYTEFNEKYYEISYGVPTPLSDADLYVRDTFARTGLDDKAGLFSIRIKALLATGETLKLCVRIDDPDWSEACESYLEVPIIGDDTWHEYKIPIIYGASSVEYEIYNESYSGIASIAIDLVEFKIGNDLGTINESDTDYISYTPTFQGFGTPTNVDFKYKRIGDSIVISGKFTSGTTTSVEAQLGLPSSLSIKSGQLLSKTSDYTRNNTSTSKRGSVLITGGDNFLNFSVVSNTANHLLVGNGDLVIASGDTMSFTTAPIPIEGWSTGRVNAFSQRREKTFEDENNFNFKASGTISGDEFNIVSTYSCTSGNHTLVFNSGIFTVAPKCSVDILNEDGSPNMLAERAVVSTSSGLTFTTVSSSGSAICEGVMITCEKTGTDFNKTQTVHGEFKAEQIKGACFNTTYSETEIECGMRNGEMVYRRCFTVASDITTSSTITTWETNLVPIGLTGYTSSGTWNFPSSYSTSTTDRSLITYSEGTGEVQTVINGAGRQVSAGTSHCMDYTK